MVPGHPHPHVVVQEDLFNHSRVPTVVVCALTSNLRRASWPGNVMLEACELLYELEVEFRQVGGWMAQVALCQAPEDRERLLPVGQQVQHERGLGEGHLALLPTLFAQEDSEPHRGGTLLPEARDIPEEILGTPHRLNLHIGYFSKSA